MKKGESILVYAQTQNTDLMSPYSAHPPMAPNKKEKNKNQIILRHDNTTQRHRYIIPSSPQLKMWLCTNFRET